ncbi:MAG: 4Fe-4S cluster-binding domain-containing protein [Bacteroidales bacterium]|jgi:L-lysine 2,3-aminomutase|nr:4Fe-4S cluster-binding domain-containing protein [Bacteroidales bacterium]
MQYQSYQLHNYTSIPGIEKLPSIDRKAIEISGRILPFKTNNYVTEQLINWDNIPDDPVFTLCFPRRDMLRKEHYETVERLVDAQAGEAQLREAIHAIRNSLNPHPAGQYLNVPSMGDAPLNGMQHKYGETVLFFPGQGQTCHAYCSFCFRWSQFTGMKGMRFAEKETEHLVRYLRQHREVTDLLFTGGDPLVMSSAHINRYVDALLDNDLDNIRTIRFGTKSFAYWPYRYLTDADADDLLRIFDKIVRAGKHPAIMAHFSHPAELATTAVQEALKRVRSTGAQIRTQSPLLRHINDRPEIWSEMWRMQVNLQCIPYYMFVARDTGACEFFDIPLAGCWDIFRKAYRQVSGICRTVRGPIMSATPGKVQILGVSEVRNEKVFVLHFLQGRHPDWVARPFFAAYHPEATWLNMLEPAFGKTKFFFEEEHGMCEDRYELEEVAC